MQITPDAKYHQQKEISTSQLQCPYHQSHQNHPIKPLSEPPLVQQQQYAHFGMHFREAGDFQKIPLKSCCGHYTTA
jgi:hypothetical protein